MTNEAMATLHPWMVLSAAFRFLAGEACGHSLRHRKCLEQINADLRNQLEGTRAGQRGASRINAGMVVIYLFCGAALGFALGMLYTQSERMPWKNVETLQQIHT